MQNKVYDVLVVGGGASGVAAALGAVKAGASCLLLERGAGLGGQAVSARVPSYCGFFTHSEQPVQVVGGIGQEVLEQLRQLGAYDGFIFSAARNAIIPLDAETLQYGLDLLVQKYPLDLLLHCHVIGASVSGNRIEAVEYADDERRGWIQARMFIDATGDANLAHLAGAQTRYGDGNGGGYFSTKVMMLDNISPSAVWTAQSLREALRKARQDGFRNLPKESGVIQRTAPDLAYALLPTVAVPALDAGTLTNCEIQTRQQAQEYLEAFRRYLPGFERARLVSTGSRLGIRDTRHIIGTETLSGDDVVNAVKRPDSIARGAWPCEMHTDKNSPAVCLWVKDGGYYDIPPGVLQSRSIGNLYAAGRTISADPVAFSSIRVMGTGFATGHAAGVAAALRIRNPDVSISEIQDELKRQGALIG